MSITNLKVLSNEQILDLIKLNRDNSNTLKSLIQELNTRANVLCLDVRLPEEVFSQKVLEFLHQQG